MIISDLSYMETASADVTGGYFNFKQAFDVDFDKDVDIKERVDIKKEVKSFAAVFGNLGQANADAKAIGPDSLAETLTLSSATIGVGSTAFSQSVSATNGAYAYYG